MKITISSQKLRDTLAIAARCAKGKATMPILSCVLLEARHADQRLYITSSNLDIGIRSSVSAKVDEDYSIALNASMLVSIAGNVAGDEITFSSKSGKGIGQVRIESGRSSFRLNGISAEEFPPVIADETGHLLQFTEKSLLSRLSAVLSAASRDASRFILNGVFVENTGDKQNFVATDGRRLHLSSSEAEVSQEKSGVILPSYGIQTLCGLLKHDGKVSLWVGARKASVLIEREEGDIRFITKVIEGNYPNYGQVIPKRTTSLSVNRQAIAAAVSRVAMVTVEKSGAVKIVIDGETMTLSAASPELGEASETLTIENPAAVEGTVAVSPILLMGAIEAVDTESIAFSIDQKAPEASPVVITSGGFTGVVMPIRLT